VQALADTDPERIDIETDVDHAPTHYTITFRYPGIMMGDRVPERINEHRVAIALPAGYPVEAPRVRWLTPIYHPNVAPSGAVCLGVLMHRYMPGLGLAYIVRMLRDIAQYRNYDMFSPYNRDAADWAMSDAGQQAIAAIGGAPAETVGEALADVARQDERRQAGRITRFTKHNFFQQED
jgi:hypothetical protein